MARIFFQKDDVVVEVEENGDTIAEMIQLSFKNLGVHSFIKLTLRTNDLVARKLWIKILYIDSFSDADIGEGNKDQISNDAPIRRW